MDNQTTQQQTQARPKKGHWKRKFLLLLAFIILASLGYGYYWYGGIIKIKKQAAAILSEYKELQHTKGKYDQLIEGIIREQIRCKDFISQSAGNFGEFEYCKKFVEWADASLQNSS